MRIKVLYLFLAMAAVTYLPRALPVIFLDSFKIGGRLKKFLRLVPYTVMAALIMPSVIFVNPDYPLIGIIGGLVAGILAWKRQPVMVCILAAIGVNMLMYARAIPY